MKSLRVAIVGYGIAGIAAAIFLRRQGHEIAHFEQAPEPAFVGGGLLLQSTGLAVLQALNLSEAALSRGAKITGVTGQNQHDMTIMDLRYEEFEPGAFGLGIQRGCLFQILRSADTQFSDLQTD